MDIAPQPQGKKVTRNALFDNSSNTATDASSEQVAEFDRLMASRITDTTNTQLADTNDSEPDAPAFQLFAGSAPKQITTSLEPIEYTLPERPEPILEEEDTDEHWRALASAAIDHTTIVDQASALWPALAYPGRVVHVNVDGSVGKVETKRIRKRGGAKFKRHAKKVRKTRGPRYFRIMSLYNGGIVKGEHLQDVIEREEKAAAAALHKRGASGREPARRMG